MWNFFFGSTRSSSHIDQDSIDLSEDGDLIHSNVASPLMSASPSSNQLCGLESEKIESSSAKAFNAVCNRSTSSKDEASGATQTKSMSIENSNAEGAGIEDLLAHPPVVIKRTSSERAVSPNDRLRLAVSQKGVVEHARDSQSKKRTHSWIPGLNMLGLRHHTQVHSESHSHREDFSRESNLSTRRSQDAKSPSRPPLAFCEGVSLFNIFLSNENTFWRLYTEAEKVKLEGSELNSITTTWRALVWPVRWHFESSIELRGDQSNWNPEKFAFWFFFLDRAKDVAWKVFSLNTIYLTIISVWIAADPVKTNLSSGVVIALLSPFAPWLLISAAITLYFLYLSNGDRIRRNPILSKLIPVTKLRIFMYWTLLAQATMMSRILVFFYLMFQSFVSVDSTSSKGMCMGGYRFPDQGNSFYMVIFGCMFDMIQIAVLTFFPFPYPWIVRISMMECFSVILRIWSCSNLEEYFPYRGRIIAPTCLVVVTYYFAIISSSLLAFERSMRTAFDNIRRQQEAATDKMKYINMLCQEVKLPAQRLLQTFYNLESKYPFCPPERESHQGSASSLSPELFVKVRIGRARAISATVNAVVDDLLFITKVEEERFEMHCKDTVMLKTLIDEVMILLNRSLYLPDKQLQRICLIDTSRLESIDTEYKILRVFLFQSLLLILTILCESEFDLLSKRLEELLGRQQDPNDNINTTPVNSYLFSIGTQFKVDSMESRLQVIVNTGNVVLENISESDVARSSCMVCHKLAQASGSTWELRSDGVQFEIACAPPNSSEKQSEDRYYPSLRMDQDGSSNDERDSSDEQRDSRRSGSSKKHTSTKMVTDVFGSWMRNQSMIYITDPTFEPIIFSTLRGVIHKRSPISGNKDTTRRGQKPSNLESIEIPPVFRNVAQADLKVRSLVFVQSMEACKELRDKNFVGKIVLFSERYNYYDDEQKKAADLGISVPCEKVDLRKLERFLLRTSREFRLLSARDPKSAFAEKALSVANSITSKTVGDASNSVYRPCWGLGMALWSMWESSFRHPISMERRESFTKWRFLSPLGYVVHHTSYFEMLGLLILLDFAFEFAFQTMTVTYGIFYGFVLIIFYCRRVMYFKLVEPCKVLFSTWWYWSSMIAFVGFLVAFFFEFVSLANNQFQPYFDYSKRANMTWAFFLRSNHGGATNGIQTLFYLINYPCTMRYNMEFFPWPFGYIVSIVFWARSMMILKFYIADFLLEYQLNSFFITISAYMVCSLFYLYLLDTVHFQSFNKLHDLLLSKDFLDRVLILGDATLSRPVMNLQELQQTFLELTRKKAFEERLLITRVLHKEMNLIRKNIFLSRGILFQLHSFLKSDSFSSSSRAKIASRMKAKLIREVVDEICSQQLLQWPSLVELGVKIFVKLDSALTLVKVDEELLSVVLNFACRSTLLKIERSIGANRSNNERHEMLIWIRADTKKRSFTDTRVMEITILDSAITSPNSWESARRGPRQGGLLNVNMATAPIDSEASHPLSEKYLRFFGHKMSAIEGNVISSQASNYRNFQRIGVPYQLCTDSHRMQTLCLNDAPRAPFSVSDAAYNRYVRALPGLLGDSLLNGFVPKKRVRQHIQQNRLEDEKDDSSAGNASKLRQFKGQAAIICCQESPFYGKLVRNVNLFKVHNWTCKIIIPHDVPQMLMFLNTEDGEQFDLVLIDVGFSFVKLISRQVDSNFRHQLNRQDAMAAPIVSRLSDDVLYYDVRDAIHLLRANMFMGTIGIIHPPPPSGRSMGLLDENAQMYANKRRQLEKPNLYKDGASADIHVDFPLTVQSIAEVVQEAEERLLKKI